MTTVVIKTDSLTIRGRQREVAHHEPASGISVRLRDFCASDFCLQHEQAFLLYRYTIDALAEFRVVAIGGVGQHRSRDYLSFHRHTNLLQSNFWLGLETDFLRYPRGLSPLLVLGPHFR